MFNSSRFSYDMAFVSVRLLLAALIVCISLPAVADGDDSLEVLRTLRYSAEAPSLEGYSPVNEINLAAPSDARRYTKAYKSKSNCVIFFPPLEKNEHDLAVKWDGGKCNGKPIQGMGKLQIEYKRDFKDGVYSQVLVYHGSFDTGALTGEGQRVNFLFDPNGKVMDVIYKYSGEFSNGMLNGAGEMTWVGPSDGEPSAWRKTGNFKDSIPSGLVTFSRLHPFQGVEADSGEVVLNADGDVYTFQWFNNDKNPVKGVMYFYNDSARWSTEISEFGASNIKHAQIHRIGYPEIVADCNAWDIQRSRWSCADGSVAIQLSSGQPSIETAEPFEIPVPLNTSSPIRIKDGGQVKIGDDNNSDESTMSCNEDISVCHGEAIVHVNSEFYWWGESEFSNGNLKPISGTLYKISADDVDLANDSKWAHCEIFNSPTRCNRGTIWGKNFTWKGGFILEGVVFRTSGGYNIAGSWNLNEEGNGRLTWDNGRWAEGYRHANEWTSIDNCDDPSSSSKFTCQLEGNTVMFSQHNSGTSSSYNPYGGSGGVYTPPIRFPQQPITILPGVR